MTDNEKIARFAGWTFYKGWRNPAGNSTVVCPNYLTDSAACLGLLNVLVEKGYGVTLQKAAPEKVWSVLVICDDIINDNQWYTTSQGDSIHEAITAAVLQVIEKENLCELKSK
jgi:hypothetical protein